MSRHRAPRRRSREVALQVLYALDLAHPGAPLRSAAPSREDVPDREEVPDRPQVPIRQEMPDRQEVPERQEAANRQEAADSPAQEMFESAAENFELPEGARAFAKELVLGVVASREEIDALLSRCTQHWRLERMAAVDRNVLRLAAYELLRTETPPAVVIDEAVELARRFGGERSPGFVNGVLDAAAHACGRMP